MLNCECSITWIESFADLVAKSKQFIIGHLVKAFL